MNSLIQTLVISILPVVFAITLHEAAHGYAAKRFGDDTAWRMGRISLNPLRHIDPIGTVLVPLLSLMLGGILFGWAKPVPVNFGRLRHPKKDMFWVAAAGPGANLLMAIGWALILKLAVMLPDVGYNEALAEMARVGININGVLMILNLLPLPPLDGGRIAVSLLPMRAALQFAQLERFGLIILLGLLFFGGLELIMRPLLRFFYAVLMSLFGF
ncbi:site-2 protease family protein [Denitratisoma sp. agr-D3]